MDYMTMNFNRNGGGGTSDYSQLSNKPSINDVTLVGNKTASDLGLMPEYEVDDTPTESSDNLITSGGVYEADQSINGKLQGAKTVEGNPITVTDAEPMNAESVKVELEPKQDLHGYDKPWAGGAGKNKLPLVLADIKTANTSGTWSGNTYTLNGVTFEVLTDSADNVEGIKVNGMASEWTTLNLDMYTFEVGNYIFSNSEDIPNGQYVTITDVGALSVNARTLNVTISESETHNIYIGIDAGIQTNNTIYHPMIRLSTESDPTFEPYSNICPISGYSEVNVENNTDTYTVSLGGTKYGGVLDVTSGVLTVDRASVDLSSLTWELASQNRWAAHIDGMKLFQNEQVTTAISDSFMATTMNQLYSDENYIGFATNSVSDVYIRNGDSVNEPTGQLVYELATPITIQLTPTQVQMLENTNNISSDGTNIQLKYQPNNVIGECKAYTDEQVQKVLPTPPTTDGTYHLECSVSGGIPTISWVLNS